MNTNDKSIPCETASAQLTDWLTDELSATDRAALDRHLAGCPACRQELAGMQQLWQGMKTAETPEPRPELRTRFYAMLDTFSENEAAAQRPWERVRTWFRQQRESAWLGRLAYSLVLLAVGLMVGKGLNGQQSSDVTQQQRIDSLSTQVQEMREMMTLSLLDNPSATERLRAVSYTKDLEEVDGRVIEALLTTLNHDPNVNVRLVTLEALAEMAHDARVREGLVQSLMRQESPLMQVALADVMVKLQEKRSLKPMRQLLRQPNVNHLVRSKIEQSIRELS